VEITGLNVSEGRGFSRAVGGILDFVEIAELNVSEGRGFSRAVQGFWISWRSLS